MTQPPALRLSELGRLEILSLAADIVVRAVGEGIGFLDPHSRGRECLITAVKVTADQTVLIGAQEEPGVLVSQRARAQALIRTSKQSKGSPTFTHYNDPLFAPPMAVWSGCAI